MLEYIAIVLTALVSLWIALFTGMALGMAPVPLGLALIGGYGLSVALILWAGAPVRRWVLGRFDSRRYSGIQRYGVVCLALAAPVVTGAHIGAALGMAFNVRRRYLLAWMVAGAALWSVILLVAGTAGIGLFA
jgi:hypothetical protein